MATARELAKRVAAIDPETVAFIRSETVLGLSLMWDHRPVGLEPDVHGFFGYYVAEPRMLGELAAIARIESILAEDLSTQSSPEAGDRP